MSSSTPLFASESSGGLGLDSLAGVEIISALGNYFDLYLEDIVARDFTDVGSLTDYLRRHGVTDDVQPQ